jgi:hypothetical protein
VTNAPGTDPSRPLLRIVRGRPDDTELAALVAVLTRPTAAPAPAPAPSRWASPRLREVLRPGPGAWRASGLAR